MCKLTVAKTRFFPPNELPPMARPPAVDSALAGSSRKYSFLGLFLGLVLGSAVALVGHTLLVQSYWWSGVGVLTGILGWFMGRQFSTTGKTGLTNNPPVLW